LIRFNRFHLRDREDFIMTAEHSKELAPGLQTTTPRRTVLKTAGGLALGSLGLGILNQQPEDALALAQDATPAATPEAGTKPNIVFIMGDDIGWFNIGAYHQGIMAGRTPNLDRLAAEGGRFTDYYAEASCTAGRANFITGQLPIRTGLTTVGQAGADVGMPDTSPTIATVLKSLGYTTGQFGKNHLGDLNKFLPTVHGFDEFFGYLYHLDAMQDPFNSDYPPEEKDVVGPRNLVHSFASDVDDETVDPRWGKVGKQTISDEGPLPPHPMDGIKYNMETFDEVIRDSTNAFIEQAVADGKAFFVWMNPTRMHVFTHLSPEYQAEMTPENTWSIQEAGMKQMDDCIGAVIQNLEDLGVLDNTIIVFTTDNGAEVFTWPDGGMTPFAGAKGQILEGGFRVPCLVRWPGVVEPGRVINDIFSGLDWFPTLTIAAGAPADLVEQLQQGMTLLDTEYAVHLDGYNQFDLLKGSGPSQRDEIWYFAQATLGAYRLDNFKFSFISQPGGWTGAVEPLTWMGIVNLRLDPFERTLDFAQVPSAMSDFYAHQFWRVVFVQQRVAALEETFAAFPPQQAPASFNVSQVTGPAKAAANSQAAPAK
jgi:arylsulfatase A-like enzyme